MGKPRKNNPPYYTHAKWSYKEISGEPAVIGVFGDARNAFGAHKWLENENVAHVFERHKNGTGVITITGGNNVNWFIDFMKNNKYGTEVSGLPVKPEKQPEAEKTWGERVEKPGQLSLPHVEGKPAKQPFRYM